jgi:hypothetical protein
MASLYLASALNMDVLHFPVAVFDEDRAITSDGRLLPRESAFEYLATSPEDGVAWLTGFVLRHYTLPEVYGHNAAKERVVQLAWDWGLIDGVSARSESDCCRDVGCGRCLGVQ